MKTVQIHEIEFDDLETSDKNSNYPISGLFIVRVKDERSDFRFVDKTVNTNICIIPESVLNILDFIQEIKPKQEEVLESVKSNKEYSQDFILEFARILLNRKHV